MNNKRITTLNELEMTKARGPLKVLLHDVLYCFQHPRVAAPPTPPPFPAVPRIRKPIRHLM